VKTIHLFTSWMHLGNEALAGAALQQQNGDTTPVLSPAAQAHLVDCPHCLARVEDFRVSLDTQRQRAAAFADARFPQSALDAQRAGILARLAERHAGARVLMFPTVTAILPRPQPSGVRWIPATLAAGLFVGLMTGQVLYLHDTLVRHLAAQTQAERDRVPHIPRYHVRWTAESGPDAQPGDATDDRLLGEIESELARGRRNPALRALDDLTPRAGSHNDPASRRYRER
jgi:hypothetical protein